MARYDLEMADYERLIRRRYKFVLLVTLIVAGFSLLFGRLKPAEYRASAVVSVDKTKTWLPEASGGEVFDEWETPETQMQEITGFAVMVRAAKKMGRVADSLSADVLMADERGRSRLQAMARKVQVSRQAGTNMFVISVTSRDPAEAQALANAVAQAYKEYAFEKKKLRIDNLKFLVKRQLADCDSQMRAIESRLQFVERERPIPAMEVELTLLLKRQKQLEEQREEVAVGISSIGLQKEKLAEFLAAENSQSPAGGRAASARMMTWISGNLEKDPALATLNSRLIEQQLELENLLTHYTASHPAVISQREAITRSVTEIRGALDRKLAVLRQRRAVLDADYARLEQQIRQVPAARLEYARLQRDLQNVAALDTMLTRRLQDVQIAEAGLVSDVRVARSAGLPVRPSVNTTGQVAGVGILLGFLLGIIGAIVREMVDTTIYSIADLERSLDMGVLAVVPQFALPRRRRRDKSTVDFRSLLTTHFAPREISAESIRILRTNLESKLVAKPCRTLLFTSAVMHEGKSLIIANLAVAFAQEGRRVLLLECNLRLPTLEGMFGLHTEAGLENILAGECDWRECVQTVSDMALGRFSMDDLAVTPGLDNLSLISFGRQPPNPSELLGSPAMTALLTQLQENFDLILIDAPPMLPVADTLILARAVDGIVVVYRAGVAPRSSLRLCLERLQVLDANILGIVLNDVNAREVDRSFLKMDEVEEDSP